MTCIEYRQQLEQGFGRIQPEAAAAEHLNSCASCRKYWQQLTALAQELPVETGLAIDADTIRRLVERVDQAIDLCDGAKPSSGTLSHDGSRWTLMKLLPAAAALLVVIGAGFGGYFAGRSGFEPTTPSSDQPTTALFGPVDLSNYDEPDDPTFDILLSDFAVDRPFDASEKLLDDITDKEMEYLAQNLDIGDLL